VYNFDSRLLTLASIAARSRSRPLNRRWRVITPVKSLLSSSVDSISLALSRIHVYRTKSHFLTQQQIITTSVCYYSTDNNICWPFCITSWIFVSVTNKVSVEILWAEMSTTVIKVQTGNAATLSSLSLYTTVSPYHRGHVIMPVYRGRGPDLTPSKVSL